ncbi:MAG: tetraacyldisaccharide 4'-kinase [Bacteroidota bacterium]
MSKLRKILYPFSLLYGEITKIRNKAYDNEVLTSVSYDFPIIAVGNLSVGGTGKTPQIEYLIRLLQEDYKIAVLSRGYKRKTKGFQIAGENSTAETIGDEPLQYYRKFKDIVVAVDADRVHGIDELQKFAPQPEVILLDDAFQHRKVQAGLYILLTPYDNLYVDDTVLPAGDLREKKAGARRAQVIVVSKSPEDLSEESQFKTAQKLKPELDQTVFFSTIDYADRVISRSGEKNIKDINDYKVLLVTGIAKTKPLTNFLEDNKIDFKHLDFPDHHDFSDKDMDSIFKEFEKLDYEKRIILTTEKDYVRNFETLENEVYYLPIKTKFIANEKDFNQLIKDYVRKSIRNS